MTFPVLQTRWVISPADAIDDPDVFPHLAGQIFTILRTPVWSTKIEMSVSGLERRRSLWASPLWKFTLGFEFLRDSASLLELQRLVTFFNSKMGSTQSFFYLDRTDFSVADCVFGTGNGSTTTFQITRTTTVGGITFTEPVRGFNGTPIIKKNGVATTAFTIGPLGQITFTTAPAAGSSLTWTGSFFYLCRFEKDSLEGLGQNQNGYWNLASLGFSGVRS